MMGYESIEISAQTRLLMIDDDEKLCRLVRTIWNHLAMLSKPNTPIRRASLAPLRNPSTPIFLMGCCLV